MFPVLSSSVSGSRLQQQTFHYERRRAVTSGIIETANSTFLLLIALRYYHAGATAKSLLASGLSVGYLLSPFVVFVVERLGIPAAKAAARISQLGAVLFLMAALIQRVEVFVLCCTLGLACSSAAIPLFTQIYQENFEPANRGRLFSQMTIVKILSAGLFSTVIGYLIADRSSFFPILLAIFSLSFAYAGRCLSRCPSTPLTVNERPGFFQGFQFVKTDRLFRHTLFCWMLMGFGNLMMLPLRVEYLANEQYGLKLSAFEVALLVSAIPNLARLMLSSVWGRLFDRLSFLTIRIGTALGFMLGIVSFFTTGGWLGAFFGAFMFGVANAGGEIVWNLWVTKCAPPDRVANYMAVHVFMTGIRGVLAPLLSFHLLHYYSILSLAWASALLILVACILFALEFRREPFEQQVQTAQRAAEDELRRTGTDA